MREPSGGGENDMVPPERALEHLSVDKAWNLLDTLSSQVSGKQAELQLMVGSRYHELIESADSIVSMKETGTEVLCLLRNFPGACSNVLEQVPSSSTSSTSQAHSQDTAVGQAPTGDLSAVIQLLLHAPAAMWAALDSNRVLEAAKLVFRCRSSWNEVSSSFSADVDSSLAAFLRSHVTYVEQFPRRIALAGTRLLSRSCDTEEIAGALAALLQLQASKEADPLRCVLELLLRRRGGAVVAMLTRASKGKPPSGTEEVLHAAVALVQRTIMDVYAIFAPGPNGSCMLLDLAHPWCSKQGGVSLSARDTKSLCTKWLSVLAPKIRALSEVLLRSVGDTNTLARIRGALWKATHGEGTWAISTPETRADTRNRAADEETWTKAACFAVDAPVLANGTHMGGLATSSPKLDLWSLLFSSIFADLAEVMLQDSLVCIREDVECRLDCILLAITGNEAGLAARKGSSGFADRQPQRPHGLMAHDILAAADTVVSLLASELRSLAEDAWCLTERGDQIAADALKTSFYLLCVEMAAGLANHLRVALQEIHGCIKSAAQQERRHLPCEGEVQQLEDAVGSFADAGLVIGRVAWMLNGQGGRPLHSALTAPGCFSQIMRGRVEEYQLRAAFVISDTNGDGVVDTEEAAEALQTVSVGAPAALALDPSTYPSFTLDEFFLFATCLLEEQRPRQHLTSCLDHLLEESLTVWAEWALEQTAALLTDGCNAVATLCCNPGMTDDVWRQVHGIWEDKTIDLDGDDGDGTQETVHFPIMISPAIMCYIEGVAAELSRILSTADLVEPTSAAHVGGDNERKGEESAMGRGHEAERCARCLAARRASADLKQALVGLCDGPQSAAARACEAAQLQLLLDALFLQRWVLDPQEAASSMDSVVATLCDLVDPINLQIYMPHLQTAASACWAACHTSLSLIFEQSVAHGTAASSISMSPDGSLGSSSSFVSLVPKARRFEILPLPLDSARLQHSNGISRVRNAPGDQAAQSASVGGAGSSAQARGIEVGRQALAGLMGQVGSVGSVLSAQNVHVQSVFGAASLFLGGRNRRSDVSEY